MVSKKSIKYLLIAVLLVGLQGFVFNNPLLLLETIAVLLCADYLERHHH